ncbi:protease inhibitor I42 family protein [Streptomyces sp. NPDC047315]|uniref:protease inhibitor I42 family protein n=1 Tax=Streptomyces sp. NPDC047315 TaxID=3155142 RepID=UPI0033CC8BA2
MTSKIRTRSSSPSKPGPRGVLAAAVALVALAAGCGESKGDSPRSHPTAESKVSVDVGEAFTLAVDENPSTGERWYLDAPEPDASVVRSRGDDYESDAESDDDAAERPGVGGTRVFTFEATGAGSTEIALLHCPVYTCTGGPKSPAPASPSASAAASRPAPERITYTVTVN